MNISTSSPFFKVLLASALLVAGARLHAQSTGLVVSSNNNVGIGTTNPQVPLQIHVGTDQNFFFDSTLGESRLSIVNDTFNANPSLRFQASSYKFLGNSGAGPYLTISSSGNVGIGTTNPNNKMEVNGGIQIDGSVSSVGFSSPASWYGIPAVEVSNNPGGAYYGGTTNGVYLGANNYWNASSGWLYTVSGRAANQLQIGNGSLNYSIAPAGTAGNLVSWNTPFVINSSGNVGIGATSPNSKLQISDSSNLTSFQGLSPGQLQIQIPNTNGDFAKLSFTQYAGQATAAIGMGFTGSGSSLYFGTSNSWGSGVTNTAMTISPSGNVGIGTTSPGYLLDVAGQVHAASFVSSTQTYADFVFKPDYKLPPLSQVEAAIKQDGHLPGIPSEEDAKAHGIDLTQMQVKLLQKIEELTLHQIEQEKQLSAQQNQLADQQQRLDAQARRIEQLEKEDTSLRAQR